MYRFVAALTVFITLSTAFSDEETDKLRREFDAYKKASEARIKALEKKKAAGGEFTQEESDALRRLAERGTLDFEFHGYLRAGYGVDGKGNAQTAFQAPNAESKYRLGNEAETYLETTFMAKTPPETTGSKDKKFETQIRLAYSIPNANNANYDSTFSLREAYGTATGLIDDNPTAGWWVGQRFYSRIQVHMSDFWYRDMSGYGGGIENLQLGEAAKLGIAWIGGSIDDLDSDGTVFLNPDGQLRKDNLDLSLTEVDFLGGEFRALFTYSYFNGDTLQSSPGITNRLGNSHGGALNLFQINEFDNGIQNLAAIQYGIGSAYNFRAQMALPTGFNAGNTPGNGAAIQTKDFQQLRFVEDITYDAGERISASGTALYQYSHLGDIAMNEVHWTSLGFRPVYHFDRHHSIATEAGWDYTDQKDGKSGSLFKLTIAPQITPEMSVLSRPALRMFFTYAWWSNDFKGMIGSPTHLTDTAGLSAGVQLETWW